MRDCFTFSANSFQLAMNSDYASSDKPGPTCTCKGLGFWCHLICSQCLRTAGSRPFCNPGWADSFHDPNTHSWPTQHDSVFSSSRISVRRPGPKIRSQTLKAQLIFSLPGRQVTAGNLRDTDSFGSAFFVVGSFPDLFSYNRCCLTASCIGMVGHFPTPWWS